MLEMKREIEMMAVVKMERNGSPHWHVALRVRHPGHDLTPRE